VKSAKAATVDDYLSGLTPERREVVATVRSVMKKNVPKGFTESIGWGMIMYSIPLERFPNTYNKQPLMYAALASNKNFVTLHMMSAYAPGTHKTRLEAAFKAAGKKLDMGKACIHFRKAEDIPLDAIGQLLSEITPEKWIEIYESSRKK
jgi:uncharacterized protein YdhG (YjbR/CyaY superfamily)